MPIDPQLLQQMLRDPQTGAGMNIPQGGGQGGGGPLHIGPGMLPPQRGVMGVGPQALLGADRQFMQNQPNNQWTPPPTGDEGMSYTPPPTGDEGMARVPGLPADLAARGAGAGVDAMGADNDEARRRLIEAIMSAQRGGIF